MVSHHPPLPVTGCTIGDMLVAGERVADQHRVGAIGVQRAVGLIGDLKRRQVDAGVEPKRLVRTKTNDVGMRLIRLAHAVGRSKHGLDHFRHLVSHRLAEASG